MTYDLLIRGGTVVDGSGLPGFRADVGIVGDRLAAIGDLKGEAAKQTIDAEGKIVAPGFIDAHTHMDAQVFWDPIGTNSCWHGVTSVVMGNCGFSLAPCPEKDKALVIRNLERAEDIPRAAMEAGIPWSWETFPQYLDAVDKLPKGINYAGYVGHSALRTYVMGERAFTDEATPDDLAAMAKEVESSLRAGAVGFSTSRSGNHRTPEGLPVASRLAAWSEVQALVGVMSKLRSGVFEISRENIEHDAEKRRDYFARIKALAVESGVPITFGNTWYHRKSPEVWKTHFEMVDDTIAAGGKILIQGTAGWNGSMRSFETLMPYDKAPVWAEFRKLPLAEQEKGLRDPEMRKKLVDIAKNYKLVKNDRDANALREAEWDWYFPFTKPLPPYKSVGEIARERGIDPIDCMIDLALESHLKLLFVNPGNNEDQDVVLAMIRHPNTAITFSDAGAHVASTLNPLHTHLLGEWVRDKQALTMEAAIRKLTFDIAVFWGLYGRGLLRKGFMADVVVFDPQTVSPAMPSLQPDLPTGALRLRQKATGIDHTIVNGKVTMRGSDHTGVLPGRLLRGSLARN
jgi:N-acyl-D-amino-acid deacylase